MNFEHLLGFNLDVKRNKENEDEEEEKLTLRITMNQPAIDALYPLRISLHEKERPLEKRSQPKDLREGTREAEEGKGDDGTTSAEEEEKGTEAETPSHPDELMMLLWSRPEPYSELDQAIRARFHKAGLSNTHFFFIFFLAFTQHKSTSTLCRCH